MNNFDRNELTNLLRVQDRPCVTIYMPTHPTGQQSQQDPIRLKNLVTQAEKQLSGHWLRPVEAREMLQPARALVRDSLFWSQAGRGLALFLTAGTCKRYRLDCALEESLFVGDQFQLRPALPMISPTGHFFLLALSQNKVTLYEGEMQRLESLAVEELPRNMAEALNYDDVDRGSQVHTAAVGVTGKQGGVFHGQGGIPDAMKDDLRAYLRAVSSAVEKRLSGQTGPLILACVDSVAPVYREVNTYPHLLDERVEGNPDYLTAAQLLDRVRPVVRRHGDRAKQAAMQAFQERKNGRTASWDVPQIVTAALQGRVDTLLVDVKAPVWGEYHPDDATVSVHEQAQGDDVDLLELAVRETLQHRGTVFPVSDEERPADSPMSAVFRY
jgi:hypothetical protein